MLDMVAITIFVKLAKAKDVCFELGDEVHPSQLALLVFLALNHHGAFSYNSNHKAITKMYRAMNCSIKIGEHTLQAHHVVGSASAQDLVRELSFGVLSVNQLDEQLVFMEMYFYHVMLELADVMSTCVSSSTTATSSADSPSLACESCACSSFILRQS
jgi:hypothetical protein